MTVKISEYLLVTLVISGGIFGCAEEATCRPLNDDEARIAAASCSEISLIGTTFHDLAAFSAASDRDVDWIFRGTSLTSLRGVDHFRGEVVLEDNTEVTGVSLGTVNNAAVFFDETPNSLDAVVEQHASFQGPGSTLLGGLTLLSNESPPPTVDLTLFGTPLEGLPVRNQTVEFSITIVDAPDWPDIGWLDQLGLPSTVTIFPSNPDAPSARLWFQSLVSNGFHGSFRLCSRGEIEIVCDEL